MAERDHIPRFCNRECQQEIRHAQRCTHAYECACTAWKVVNRRGPHLMVRPVRSEGEWVEVSLPERVKAPVVRQETLL